MVVAVPARSGGAPGQPPKPAVPTPQRYLMCQPEFFAVKSMLNVWMDPTRPATGSRAEEQWKHLVAVLTGLGHQVEELGPRKGLPDQVFTRDTAVLAPAADGGLRVLEAGWRYQQREPETGPVMEWLARNAGPLHVTTPRNHIEGGDVVDGGPHGLMLGHGFRSHYEAAEDLRDVTGRTVTTLRLVDPCFYHLDMALAVIRADRRGETKPLVAYYPDAFDGESQMRIWRAWPEAIRVERADAAAFGLNLITDGFNVVMPKQAASLAHKLERRGARVIGVDFSELAAAGGGPNCCVLPVPTHSTEPGDGQDTVHPT